MRNRKGNSWTNQSAKEEFLSFAVWALIVSRLRRASGCSLAPSVTRCLLTVIASISDVAQEHLRHNAGCLCLVIRSWLEGKHDLNMSKVTPQYHESAESDHAQPSSLHDFTTTEHQEDAALPKVAAFDNAQRFADLYGLTQHIDLLRKVAVIAQGDTPVEDIGLSTAELQALQDEKARKWHQPKMLYFTVLVCSIGAIEQGWAQTGMNGANLYFPKAFGIGSDSKHDNFVVGLINSGIYLSAGLLGAWISDPVNNRLGRRGTVFVGSFLCLGANLGSSVSETWPQLLVSRLVLGIGLGLNASTVSVFAAECAPADIRGGLAVSWQMWTAFGVFIGFVTNAAVYQVSPCLTVSRSLLT